MPTSRLYDDDFYAWANEQATLLREGKLAQADIEHIAQEIESMGKTEKRELASRLKILILHLLKWRFQPLKRTASWSVSITVQRHELIDHLDDNPSLKPLIDGVARKAYGDAVLRAMLWTFEEMIAEDFWPPELSAK
ncbi:DUF29 domain-containing protein [Methylosinus sp. Sm6]|uniref:DUF29 domain-containing protein n=1 Tax=Methylosinus sp. Sm6 TaxID=2866948 RepID=UPI001C9A073B|nr:DUF29 domain-containing protein [Methylosinus sp. Sm6]MBY6240332.1 DUF29 domain-containing protein [Methylosinus sp. Sm6]